MTFLFVWIEVLCLLLSEEFVVYPIASRWTEKQESSLHLNYALRNCLQRCKMLKAQANKMYWQCHTVIYRCLFVRKSGQFRVTQQSLSRSHLQLQWGGGDWSESRHYVRGLECTQKGQKKQRKERNNNWKSLGLEGSDYQSGPLVTLKCTKKKR